jgi:cell shape-determining protein MreC
VLKKTADALRSFLQEVLMSPYCAGPIPIVITVCISIITLVILITGILSIIILLRIQRTLKKVEETFQHLVGRPLQMMETIFSLIARARQFFSSQKQERKKQKKE